jgi:YggT family protein
MQTQPILQIIYLIVNPVLLRIQRFVPLIAGIDISPIFALLALTLINMLIVQSLFNFGTQIILG